MRDGQRVIEADLKLPESATSHDGYAFSPASDRWPLSKDIAFSLAFLQGVTPETNLGFRLALTRYAEEMSARHTGNMKQLFSEFIRVTKASAVTDEALINWRSKLGTANESKLGGLKGFLLTWHEWEFPGVSDEVVGLLRDWRFKGYERGRAVAQGDPHRGPLTEVEHLGILDWAHRAVKRDEIGLETYAYLLTVMMTARRPIQIAALRGTDLIAKGNETGVPPQYIIRFPRAKQRGAGFRGSFRELPVIEDLYLILRAQHQASVTEVEQTLGCAVPVDLAQQIPIFINNVVLNEIPDLADLRDILMGDAPDRLHARSGRMSEHFERCKAACTVKSEHTGESIHLTATRFRYTRGTNLRRQGFGAHEIAHALDHSDTQQVTVYTENTAQEAVIVNHVVGPKLAPLAQACMGTLVNSERDAIRGDDPRSRVPNHKQKGVGTCGNFGFCSAGYRACYTCHHFQPWVNGPHEDVLMELYEEKQRAADVGCAREVVNANDRLILAVEHVVALCRDAKATKGEGAKSPETEHAALNDG